jgi:exodeoxyribonuclease V gamma subunit
MSLHRTSSLRTGFVAGLAEIVEPVAEWANSAPAGRGLFAADHLLVPTNGVKAWLLPEMTRRVGVRRGYSDGVVANVNVGYLGSLSKFIVPQRYRQVDPWSIESMTGVILQIIATDADYTNVVRRAGGALQAAAKLADRFDRYHVRRPMMIRAWEQGSPVLSPTTADSFNDGEWRADDLGGMRWQFDLWRRMREVIGLAPWPVQIEAAVQQLRRGENIVGVPDRLMVAGMQSLSLGAIELLEAFGHVSDVQVLLVHPSSTLAEGARAEHESRGVRRGALQLRPADEVIPGDVHPMVHSWLRGARELHEMVASQGIDITPHEPSASPRSDSLLGRIQGAVARGGVVPPVPRASNDVSVQIHRCYSLTRQVEALHDALLHAFREIENLQPHEVVILSPRLAEAAPILEAVFDRTVKVDTGDGERQIRIPLAVAERELRYVNPGAEFLGDLLALVTGRFDISSFLKVALSPLVVDHLGVDGEDEGVWQRQIERARVRWGLSAGQRSAAGLSAEVEGIHTWRSAIERALLGAALPDATAAVELGGVVPLSDIGVDDLDSLAILVQILAAVEEPESLARGGAARSIAEWCSALETAIGALCGGDDKTAGAFELIAELGATATLHLAEDDASSVDVPVTFADVAAHLLGQISGMPGHQPLRTGAVTAASLMPLRGVPYRVVCLLGIDDGIFGGGETETDDLVGQQVFIGDDDPRIDSRRQLLDAVLAAGDRVVITCDGRSIRNNANIPLTTALAEFVDFARSLGVAERSDEKGSEIEYLHPRHATSPRNFSVDGVMPGIVWSHSVDARDVATRVGQEASASTPTVPTPLSASATVVDLASLTAFVRSPLKWFVNKVLDISTWVDDPRAADATIPLGIDWFTRRDIVSGAVAGLSGAVPGWNFDDFVDLAKLNGLLPVGPYGAAAKDEIRALAASIVENCAKYAVLPVAPESMPLTLSLSSGVTVRGDIVGLQVSDGLVGMVKLAKKFDEDHLELALHLLMATACGHDISKGISVHVNKEDVTKSTPRLVYLGPDIDQADATSRLATLVDLMARAGTTPMPSFGATVDDIFDNPAAADRAAGRKTFDKYVVSDAFKTSLEWRIFGDAPDFDTVFDESGPVMAFWHDFHRVLHFVKGKATHLSKPLPHGNSHWGVL